MLSDNVTQEVDCPPYGLRNFVCEIRDDSREDIEAAISDISKEWDILWPKLKEGVSKLLLDWQKPDYFSTSGFTLKLEKSGDWVDNDFFIEVIFDDADGFWSIFFKDLEVIHAQPSF